MEESANMDEQKFKAKQMALDMFEKLMKKNLYNTNQELFADSIKLAKSARETNKPRLVVMACDELVQIVQTLSTDEVKQLSKIIRRKK